MAAYHLLTAGLLRRSRNTSSHSTDAWGGREYSVKHDNGHPTQLLHLQQTIQFAQWDMLVVQVWCFTVALESI